MVLSDSITKLKGVGPALSEKLALLGVTTVRDLIYFFPRRYDDFSHVTKLKDVQPGPVTVKVKVEKVTARHVRRGLHITEAIIADETSKLRAVWFNQPYRPESLKSDAVFYMSGTFDFQRDRFILQNPSVEKVAEFAKNTARIVPIYPQVRGLKSYQLRQMISQLLPLIAILPDTLPPEVVKRENLLPLSAALLQMHFPESHQALQEAKKRIAFEELFELLLAAHLNKVEHRAHLGWEIPYEQAAAEAFTAALSFTLTNAQRRVAWEILQDIQHDQPMNRLLQGDVGSGKTVVAAFAAFMAGRQGMQSAFMAPTEVLAAQHAESLSQLLRPLGMSVGLLVGSVKPGAKKVLTQQIKEGNVDIVVGTHALIQQKIEFAKLGLVVIDEQHRFGVNQRKALLAKSDRLPHLLAMTATPIPRSLTLTVYGELDVSVIDERPPGRTPIITEIHSPHSVKPLYEHIDQQINQGRQVYIICPLVSESDTLGFKSVEQEYDRLQKSVFKHRRIGLLHGQLSSVEKDEVMTRFKNGEFDILVATTVVEVGVDVPNATIMLIEGADRFGLAQLHQLRGRVGRGKHQSYCYLVPSTAQKPSQRLQEVARSDDGFYLAQVDLELRGPGELYGTRQHGSLDLRVANIADTKLVSHVQKVAEAFATTATDLLQYPELHKRVERLRRVTTFN
ncbi:MAG TPA: ATP-dependent DNA helicase RecG [Candidatus Saccharimonadales bacterium]|nr:ATP-dependent DNA helicase RecG [Candidatus Saccharimonadales bacterium]